MGMVGDVLSQQLYDLMDQYKARFKEMPSLFETTLDQDALIARLKRALAEGKPYDPRTEEWPPEFRKQVESGAVLL